MRNSSVEDGSNVSTAGHQNRRLGGCGYALMLRYHFELGSEMKGPKKNTCKY